MVVYTLSSKQAAFRAELIQTHGIGRLFSFQCNRQSPKVDPRIAAIYTNATQGKAHLDMIQALAMCPKEHVAGNCGDRRGDLTECRCPTLSRLQHPEIRRAFENRVIARAIAILKSRPSGQRTLNLAFFASGQLLGEVTLLFRLFDSLRKEGLACSINISLIDTCYTEALSHNTTNEVLDAQNALKQFLCEMCKTLPPNVTLSGQVFGHSDTYVRAVNRDPSKGHDLLVGADIENLNGVMAKVDAAAKKRPTEKPLVLIKDGSQQGPAVPKICAIEANGQLSRCTNPSKKTGFTALEKTVFAFVGVLIVGYVGSKVYSALCSNSSSKQSSGQKA